MAMMTERLNIKNGVFPAGSTGPVGTGSVWSCYLIPAGTLLLRGFGFNYFSFSYLFSLPTGATGSAT